MTPEQKKKEREEVFLGTGIAIALFLVFGIIYINIPCKWLFWSPTKDLPARCLNMYQK